MKTDYTETEIEGGRVVLAERGLEPLQPLVLVVSGPDDDGDICLLASGECYLSLAVAKQLADEILRRVG